MTIFGLQFAYEELMQARKIQAILPGHMNETISISWLEAHNY